MSAQVSITQLPAAGAITGSESVPIVQNGVTVRTTTGAIAASPSQTQTFLTEVQELTLPNSRYLSSSSGINFTDGGANSYYRINLTGAVSTINAAAGGIMVKDGSNTIVARAIATSGNGLGVSNGDGTGGNPTLALSGLPQALANYGGTGFMSVVSGTTLAGRQFYGTTNQIVVTNGNGSADPVISFADNAVMPGTGALTIPIGTTAQTPSGTNGQLRYNSSTQTFDGYSAGQWRSFTLTGGVTSFSAGSTGFTPSTNTSGIVTLAGTLNVASGGTGANSLTGYVKGSGTSVMTASSTIPTTDLSGTVTNAQIANPQVTVNGTTVSLGGSGTITAANPNALTFGTGFSAGSYTGASATTINLANTAVTAASYGAASKTLTATVNAQGQLTALADTPIAITNTQVSGLGTMSTQNASNVTISGGSVNGTTIGATTAAAGTFTSVTMTSGTISSAPVGDTDIVNKLYADSIASGINFHQPCNYATTADFGTVLYNNGASGVGATLTKLTPFSTLAVDGGSPTVGQRILVKNQTNGAYNGVYTVTSVGSGVTGWVLTRATDYDSSGTGTNEIDAGDYLLILAGTANGNTSWVQQTGLPITVGTTALVFLQFAAPITYSAGTGLNLSPSTTFNISNTGVTAGSYGIAGSVPTIAINSQGQITSASNTAIAISASQVTSGTFGNAFLTNSSLTVNGTSISLGGSGTITAANPNALTIGTGLTGTSYTGASAVTIALATSGVTAATYGSASNVPVFAVDTYGRVTSVTNTAIAIAAGAVSGLAASATTDTTNAANITSGTLPAARLSGSYTGITGVGTLAAGTWNGSAIGVAYGGTGLTATPSNGQLAIGNGTGYTLATLTAGTNVSISNSAGGIQISATASAGGTVTSVAATVPAFLSVAGSPITTSGTLAISYSGTALPVANGGTGATTLTGHISGNGTGAFTASTTIPNTDITGLGTMSTQSAGAVAITGGTINGTTVGATTASTVRGTTITATTQVDYAGSTSGTTTLKASAVAGATTITMPATTGTMALTSDLPTVNNGTLTLAVSGTGLSGSASFTANQAGSSSFTVTSNATNANTASTIVARDASGNFTAGTITAALTGNVTGNVTGSSGSCTGNSATATTATTATTANALNSANNYSVTRLTATPNTSGVSTGITCVNGDMTAYRSGGTTGVIYLSSSGSNYLYWDSTNYNLNGGNLVVTGNVTAYSDETLKKDWAGLAPDFVERLAKVKHGTYTRIDSGDRQAGASAQAMQEILPEVVQTDEKGKLSLAYGNAALVAAVKLAERVVALEARLAALEAKG
jgi:hypothetical protein